MYFSARTYAGAVWTHPAGGGVAAPYYADGGAEFIEPRTFQVISPGLDGNFGAASTAPKQFKSGLNYTAFDEDNITSFSEGTTLGANRP